MKILEIYDGESRSKVWWITIKKHTATLAIIVSSFVVSVFFILFDIYGTGAFSGALVYIIIMFVALWPLFIGISMINPRFSFSLFYWNGWLITMGFLPSLLLSFVVLIVVFNIDTDSHLFPIKVYIMQLILMVIAISIKTKILYNRYAMVGKNKNEQYLPL